ncbi:DUF4177 domain-containing protein [Pseudooceanicola sp. HF7]|uniref:DUF4177 domain-containing protein n=1 Tax=Pseudooceanicola sp. HF7 TaxID=2721560 RepID=UPI0014317193|nr:DUF4177 domain-containing protein [Pseudooceanicola sp. HF7]NIZ09166.1 DUF4177 domain-containing protein [Pseudooceanicola sp. HF7]
MSRYEYKVVPAPTKAPKARGVKTSEGRFALTLEELMNEMAAKGWEYQRAEMLPQEERSGLTGSTTTYRNVLIFRRALQEEYAAEVMEPATPEETPVVALSGKATQRLGSANAPEGARGAVLTARKSDDDAPEVDETTHHETGDDESGDEASPHAAERKARSEGSYS